LQSSGCFAAATAAALIERIQFKHFLPAFAAKLLKKSPDILFAGIVRQGTGSFVKKRSCRQQVFFS